MSYETATSFSCACERCGHLWLTKGEVVPNICPKCKSVKWNEPRTVTFVGDDPIMTDRVILDRFLQLEDKIEELEKRLSILKSI